MSTNIAPNLTTAIFLVNQNVRAIKAIYEKKEADGNPEVPRTVFKTFDHSIVVGDLLVVPTNTRHGMTVVKVVEVDVEIDFESPTLIDWVAYKINLADYADILKGEKEMLDLVKSAEKRRKQEALKAAIFSDQADKINSLSIAHNGGDTTPAIESPKV